MTVRKHANNYGSTLNGSINNSVTTVIVSSATGLPTISGSDFYNLTLDDAAGNIEIITVTARSGTSLTVARGAEGSMAQSWTSGVAIQLRPTADSLDRKLDIANANTFGHVAVSGQTTCDAGSVGDTLTMAAGANVTLTTSGNTITIASSGGGSGITTLTGDVTATGSGSVVATLATVTVPKGGTGLTTQNAYGVLCGGTTSTAAMQSIAPGTSTYVLTSNGAGSLPSWQAPSGGGSITVSGTSARITATLTGSNYAVDISASYTGQSSITTLGTIGSGQWASTAIPMTYGGSGDNITPSNGGVICCNATTMTIVNAVASANRMLLSGGTAAQPFWSASTIPQNAGSTAGLYLKADGSQHYVMSTCTLPDTGTTNSLLVGSAGTAYIELATGNSKVLGTDSSGNVAWQAITGTGNHVLATSPTLVTPALGTPSSGTLTSCAGLPISTGVSGLGTGVATFLATPSSANLAAALTDETGSGSAVFATSPTLVTPLLGTPTSGVLTNCTALPLTSGVTGTLPRANGGTGLSVAGNAGNRLTSDGTNWVSTTPVDTVAYSFFGGF